MAYPVQAGDSLEAGTLLAATFAALATIITTAETGMILEDGLDQGVGALLELIDDAVVQGILVLLEPAGHVVWHGAGVVHDGEVGLLAAGLGRLRTDEVGRLAQVVRLQLLLEGLVSGLRDDTLLFQDGQNAHGLSGAGDRQMVITGTQQTGWGLGKRGRTRVEWGGCARGLGGQAIPSQ